MHRKNLICLALLFLISIACSITIEPPQIKALESDAAVPTNAESTVDIQATAQIPEQEVQLLPTHTPSFQINSQPKLVDRYWHFIEFPTGEYSPNQLLVHQQNENIWYMTGVKGEKTFVNALLITRDAGHTWEIHFENGGIHDVFLDPFNSDILYLVSHDKLWYSDNAGHTWELLHDFEDEIIGEIYKSKRDGRLFAVTGWQELDKVGIYISGDGRKTWTFHSFNPTHDYYLPWDIAEHPKTGDIYVMGEIADHPAPYQPVFYHSVDGGLTWEERFDLPWHATKVDFSPVLNDVYTLTEGVGLYRSINSGESFERLSNYFWSTMKIDQNNQGIIYGGNHTHNNSGGVFMSYDAGFTFKKIGLQGVIISSIDLNHDSSRIYAAGYQKGIYFADTDQLR